MANETRLDGNSAAGLLSEIFVTEITGVRGSCRACGLVAELGSTHAYMAALSPGAVIRCSACESVLMVLANVAGKVRLGTPGLTWMEFGGA